MKTSNRSAWWLAALVLAVCLLVLGYRHLNRQTGRGDHNPYAYDIDEFKHVDDDLLTYSELDAIELEQDDLSALAVDGQDRILLVAGNRVYTYTRNGKQESSFETESPATSIAVSEQGKLFLGIEDHIAVYSPAGERIESWTSLGEQGRITSLAIVGRNLYAADYGNRLVWRFDLDGKLLGNIEGVQAKNGKAGFLVPSPSFEVARGRGDSLWITNPGNTAVQEYRPDGALLRSWGKASMEIAGFSGCCNPAHIAPMESGDIVTAEKGLPRVKVYSPDGELKAVVAGPRHFDEPVRGTGGKVLIQDLAVNGAGEILVLDANAKKIRVFNEN